MNDFTEIPEVLRRAARTAGPALRQTLEDCISPSRSARQAGHANLAKLGPAGRAIAGSELLRRLDDPDSFTVSEAAYSLGLLDPRSHKTSLCDLVDSHAEADVLGRTLTVLRSVLVPADLPRIRGWLRRFEARPAEGQNPERITAYLEYLLVYVKHKHLG